MEGGEDPLRVDWPLITQMKRELEMQLRLNEELSTALRASNTNGLLLKQITESFRAQELANDNALHKENMRLTQEIVKRDAMIDLLGREIDRKGPAGMTAGQTMFQQQ